MSASDLKHTIDQQDHLAEQPRDKTTDQTRQDCDKNTDVTGTYLAQSYGSIITAEGDQRGTVVPTIPGYEINGILGRGGMGIVYRALQTTLRRRVAIKMILGGKYTDPVAQTRFMIEAEVIAAIQHPNIVQVHEFGRHDDQPYFVLEFVGGGSLAGRLKVAGRFSPRDAATMVAKLADGMAAAHQKGVIHRDLKPANVLLTESGEPKVTDFGLAKTGQSDMTATGAVVGTPSYMSPEQAAGKTRDVGTPTDVYALGVILYELLTGRRPFKGDTMMATIQQLLTQEPVQPRGIEPKISRDLETICLKCLEKDAKKRYATMSELASDLRAFLDDRPITARPVGLLERTWKWTKRNPAWTAGISAGVLLVAFATFAALVIREQGIEKQKATHVAGLVQRVLDADTAQVPAIIGQMAEYRKWVDPLLLKENEKALVDSRQKLHTSLALLPVDANQVKYLLGRLLDATPQEVLVIRDALTPKKFELLDKLWAVMLQPDHDKLAQRLRAAAALASYDPENEKWVKSGEPVVNELILQNPVFLGLWSEALRPVKNRLLPRLSEIFRDHQPEHAAERSLASNILADYAADQPHVLADLLMDADEKQFAILFPIFKDRGEQGIPVLISEIDKIYDTKLPSSDENREKLAKRQSNAAVALLRMNQPAKVWPLFQHRPDPRVRSYLIHKLKPLGANTVAIVMQLGKESDLTIRRALLLSLGEFGEADFPPDDWKVLVQKVQQLYRTEADPGLHAATEWMLRQWKQEAFLQQVIKEWARSEDLREKRLETITKTLVSVHEKYPPQWYVNGQGQSLVVIPGPVTFNMGSPQKEVDRQEGEIQHKKRIGRTFALGAKAVTVEQYRQFAKGYSLPAQYTRTADMPVVGITWYKAAEYCNWLSKEEGIPEGQWCYEIQESGTKLKEKYLSLTGYRLPTEAEMEYATRAGAITSRYYGETEELLPRYAWYQKNSLQLTWPVGSLKPNDLGFFDVLGNVFNWCQESRWSYPIQQAEAVAEDKEDQLEIKGTESRMLRGGACDVRPSFLRSATRNIDTPSNRNANVGFRVARTILISSLSALPLPSK